MAESEHDWPEIRRSYEETEETVASILKRFGVAQTTFYGRVTAEGWRKRMTDEQVAAPQARKLKTRLARAIARRLDELEAASGKAARDAVERERDTRTLAALVKLQEKLQELERPREQPGGRVEWTQEYRDRKRAELAQRVIRMLEQARGAPLPDGP